MNDEHDDDRHEADEPVEPGPARREESEGPADEAEGAADEAEGAADGAEAEAGAPSEPEIEILGYEALNEGGGSLGNSEGDEEIELADFQAEAETPDDLAVELAAAREQAEELRREKAQAEAELATARDHLRRTAADFENYRKRIERDRVEERKQAAAGLVLKLLAVGDNFRRALEQAEPVAEEHEVLAGFVEGMRLVEGQFLDILRAAGLEPVGAEGAFDPAIHEALMQEPTTEAPHLSVLEVFEEGYRFGGRLLRPARVKVALNPGAAEAGAEESVEEGSNERNDGADEQDRADGDEREDDSSKDSE